MQKETDEELMRQAAMRDPVIAEVRAERERQDAMWGEQKRSPAAWVAIASEELGEAAEQALNMQFQARREALAPVAEATQGEYRRELIQLAATACAAWECSVYGSAPAPNEADRNRVLDVVTSNLKRCFERVKSRAEKLDPLLNVCGLQYILGELAGYALDASGMYDDARVQEHALALASAAINAVIFLDLGKWTWDDGEEVVS